MTRGVNTAGGRRAASHSCRAGPPGLRVLRAELGLSSGAQPCAHRGAHGAERLWWDRPGSNPRAPRSSVGAPTCGHVAHLSSTVIKSEPHRPTGGRHGRRACPRGYERVSVLCHSSLGAFPRVPRAWASHGQWTAECPLPSSQPAV